jgi:hypothetical protein
MSYPARQELPQLREELLPPSVGTPESLVLIRPEARLFHA